MAVERPASRFPCLPFELERDIFELTARRYPESAFNLVLVSTYVQQWIEAIIYETVVLDFPLETTQLFLRTLNARPPEFFAQNVKNIHLTSIIPFSEAQRILSVCTGVTSLTCWTNTPRIGCLLPLIPTGKVERLSVKMDALWDVSSMSGQRFVRDSFSRLSHIDLVDPQSVHRNHPSGWLWLQTLPALTHVCFGDLFASDHLHIIHVLPDLLDKCRRLQALVLISYDPPFVSELEKTRIGDPRLVVLPCFHHPKDLTTYWKGIRRGEQDFWAFADQIVERSTYKKAAAIQSRARRGSRALL